LAEAMAAENMSEARAQEFLESRFAA